jgi:hypothetical protein
MKVHDIILEDSPVTTTGSRLQKLVLMSGRYQPPHIGHMQMWKWLTDKFGECYVATSDKVDPPRSPFNFQEKKRLFMFAGVAQDKIVQVKNPYRADEIVSQHDAESTALLFAVSEKDMAEDPRFSFKPKKDGSPSYLQPYKKNQADLKPLSQHGYVVTVPTFSFKVLGKPMRSATEFRSNFANADESTQAKMIQGLYGDYDEGIHQLLREKIV